MQSAFGVDHGSISKREMGSKEKKARAATNVAVGTGAGMFSGVGAGALGMGLADRSPGPVRLGRKHGVVLGGSAALGTAHGAASAVRRNRRKGYTKGKS